MLEKTVVIVGLVTGVVLVLLVVYDVIKNGRITRNDLIMPVVALVLITFSHWTYIRIGRALELEKLVDSLQGQINKATASVSSIQHGIEEATASMSSIQHDIKEAATSVGSLEDNLRQLSGELNQLREIPEY